MSKQGQWATWKVTQSNRWKFLKRLTLARLEADLRASSRAWATL